MHSFHGRPTLEDANRAAPAFARIFKEMILVTHPAKPLPRAPKGTVVRKLALVLYEREIQNLFVIRRGVIRAEKAEGRITGIMSRKIVKASRESPRQYRGRHNILYRGSCNTLWLSAGQIRTFRPRRTCSFAGSTGKSDYLLLRVACNSDTTRIASTRRF